MTPAQGAVLAVLPAWGERGLTARQVARAVWPDDPAWRRRTSGGSATHHNGALGATMPLRAGRVLAALERAGAAEQDDRRWTRSYP